MKKIIKIFLFLFVFGFILFLIFKNNLKTNKMQDKSNVKENVNISKNENNKNNMQKNIVVMETSEGNMILELSENKPLTTTNFLKLVNSNFYNGVKFHRVIKGFMIQAGDPNSKNDDLKNIWGTGGPGYKFDDEIDGKEQYTIGTLAMANSGPNTNGSQFFIMTSNTPLPKSYTVFGKVIDGIDVAMKIENAKTDSSDRPIKNITINKIVVK